MSKILAGILVAAAIAAPAVSFAQSNGPLTRAQVRADLVRVEQAGYNPARAHDVDYPADIQAAEAKIAAQNNKQSATQDVGGATQTGSAASGATVHPMSSRTDCVGPATFCDPYSGH